MTTPAKAGLTITGRIRDDRTSIEFEITSTTGQVGPYQNDIITAACATNGPDWGSEWPGPGDGTFVVAPTTPRSLFKADLIRAAHGLKDELDHIGYTVEVDASIPPPAAQRAGSTWD